MSIDIYVARHATPDWERKDIRYDIAPGLPLTTQGETEAVSLGRFIAMNNIIRVYASPLVRAKRTAELATMTAGVPMVVDEAIREWSEDCTPESVTARVMPMFDRLCIESVESGPVCMVTHGGPLKLLLRTLGMDRATLQSWNDRFDNHNPAPPAGTWRFRAKERSGPWTLELAFTP